MIARRQPGSRRGRVVTVCFAVLALGGLLLAVVTGPRLDPALAPTGSAGAAATVELAAVAGSSATVGPSAVTEPSVEAPSPPSAPPDVPPTSAPTPAPFRVAAFDIQDLEDSSLPYTGAKPLDLDRLAQATDADGIPVITRSGVNGGRPFHQPTGIASFGLQLLDGFRQTHDDAYLESAQRVAGWIRSAAVTSGGAQYLPHDFAFAVHGDRRETLAAGWYSGMAQGLALSFFSRLHRVTGDPADLAVAEAIFRSIRHIGRGDRPWVSYIDGERYLWIEEYAGLEISDHTLNGFIFAAFGLYDYDRETADPVARETLLGALTTLRHYAGRYRSPGGISFYCLSHEAQSAKYHRIHQWQLSALSRISGDAWFLRLSRLLAADHPGA